MYGAIHKHDSVSQYFHDMPCATPHECDLHGHMQPQPPTAVTALMLTHSNQQKRLQASWGAQLEIGLPSSRTCTACCMQLWIRLPFQHSTAAPRLEARSSTSSYEPAAAATLQCPSHSLRPSLLRAHQPPPPGPPRCCPPAALPCTERHLPPGGPPWLPDSARLHAEPHLGSNHHPPPPAQWPPSLPRFALRASLRPPAAPHAITPPCARRTRPGS
jgi:hypothetical protein